MERHELEGLCRAAGMKLSSFNNRIAYSPIIEERGHGVYGLRGGDGSALADGAGAVASGAGDETPRPGDIEHFRTTHRR